MDSVRAERDPYWADVVLVLGMTGLRSGEARAMRVKDVRLDDGGMPRLDVQRPHPDGSRLRNLAKSGKNRVTPVPDKAQTAVRRLMAGKRPNDLLFTGPRGGMLWEKAFMTASRMKHYNEEAHIHALRHTAGCLWLRRGVPVTVVPGWATSPWP